MTAQRVGCLAAEVGIPFSDPLADGPTIQRTGQIAITNGMTLARALAQIREARQAGLTMPLTVMTYINPVLTFGIAAFAGEAASAGVDGVIIPDLPLDEAADVRAGLHGAASRSSRSSRRQRHRSASRASAPAPQALSIASVSPASPEHGGRSRVMRWRSSHPCAR